MILRLRAFKLSFCFFFYFLQTVQIYYWLLIWLTSKCIWLRSKDQRWLICHICWLQALENIQTGCLWCLRKADIFKILGFLRICVVCMCVIEWEGVNLTSFIYMRDVEKCMCVLNMNVSFSSVVTSDNKEIIENLQRTCKSGSEFIIANGKRLRFFPPTKTLYFKYVLKS